MDGTTEFTNQGGKDPSFDHNNTLLDLHREGEVPDQGPLSLSGGEILGEFVGDDIGICNQNGESLQKSVDNVQAGIDDTTSTADQHCAELRGILDLSSTAFPDPGFEADLFGSPDRDLFLSNDGGERSRSYPPSPTAPSFLSKPGDEPTGLTVLSLEGAMGGLKKVQTGQLPSSWLAALDTPGKEFQTIRLQDPNAPRDDQKYEGNTASEITDKEVCDGQTPDSLAEAVMILNSGPDDNNVDQGITNHQIQQTSTVSVTDMSMCSLLTETMSTSALNNAASPLNAVECESSDSEHLPFVEVELKNLATPSGLSTSAALGESSGTNSSGLLLNVDHIDENQISRLEDGRLVYVITTKDQCDGSLSKFQITVDPNAIQAIPIETLTGAGVGDEQWIMGEQILESGGGDASRTEVPNSIPGTLVFPNQAVIPVVDVGQPKQSKQRTARGKRSTKTDTGPKNMWLKKNQPLEVIVCPYHGCGQEFTSKTKFEAHATSHAVDRPFKCTAEGCEWSFPSNTKLQRHLTSHEGLKPYICLEPGCGKQFGNYYNLKTHEQNHRKVTTFSCIVEDCSETFRSKKKLQIHLREHFAETRLKCPVPGCNETFLTPNARGSHLRRHGQVSKVYHCEYEGCNKTFDKESRLIYHTRSHTGERPYKCTYPGCKWAFTSHQKLKRHECRHTGRKDFQCPLKDCGKTFTRREHLQAHEVAHRGELPFECKEPGCNARFSQRSSLSMHKKRHLNGKPDKVFLYSCGFGDCMANFSTRMGLKNHMIKGHMDHMQMIDVPSMDQLEDDGESLNPCVDDLSPSTSLSPTSPIASSVLANQPDTVSAAMSSAMLSHLKDTDAISETVQSTMSIQLPDVVQPSTLGVTLGGDQNAISLLSSINMPPSRSYGGIGSPRTDYCSLGKKSPMFALSSSDSLVQSRDFDVIDSMDISPPSMGSVTSVVPTSFALTSSPPLTLCDPTTGANFMQTQLLQDDPDVSDLHFDLGPPASTTSNQSSMHGVLPVSSLLGDSDGCPVSTTADFLGADEAFEGSTINLQDLA